MVTNDEDNARLKVTNTAVDPLVATANGRDQCFDEFSDRINGLLEYLRGLMPGSTSISEDFAAETVINSELNSRLQNTTVAVTQVDEVQKQSMLAQQQSMAQSRTLFVFIENQTRILSEDDLLPIFAIHGGLERIVLLRKSPNLQALILYDNTVSAIAAMNSLDGRCIYDDCCELCIEFSDYFVPPKPLAKQLKQRSPGKEVHRSCLMKCSGEEFEPMPILLVSIHNQFYPITGELLHQVFGAHGPVKEIDIVEEFPTFQARIKYHFVRNAVAANESLDGSCIYDGCCNLEVELLYQKVPYEPCNFKQNGTNKLQEECVDVKSEAGVNGTEESIENNQEISMVDSIRPTSHMLEKLNLRHDAAASYTIADNEAITFRNQGLNNVEGIKVSPELLFNSPSLDILGVLPPLICSVKCGKDPNVIAVPNWCYIVLHPKQQIEITTAGNIDIEPWPNWKFLGPLNENDVLTHFSGLGFIVRLLGKCSWKCIGECTANTHFYLHSYDNNFRNNIPEMYVAKEVGYPPPGESITELLKLCLGNKHNLRRRACQGMNRVLPTKVEQNFESLEAVGYSKHRWLKEFQLSGSLVVVLVIGSRLVFEILCRASRDYLMVLKDQYGAGMWQLEFTSSWEESIFTQINHFPFHFTTLGGAIVARIRNWIALSIIMEVLFLLNGLSVSILELKSLWCVVSTLMELVGHCEEMLKRSDYFAAKEMVQPLHNTSNVVDFYQVFFDHDYSSSLMWGVSSLLPSAILSCLKQRVFTGWFCWLTKQLLIWFRGPNPGGTRSWALIIS